MLIGGSGWGTVFCCFLRLLHDLLTMENDYSGNDGAGYLFWGIKNLSSCCFLVSMKFFSHFIGKCQCKYAVRFEMKTREETYGCNRPIRHGVTTHYDWFASVNKYLRGKIRRTSLKLYRNLANPQSFFKTKILLHHCTLPYSVHFPNSSRTNCPNWTASSRTSGTIFGLSLMADTKLNPCKVGKYPLKDIIMSQNSS